jgi:proliferating cell nuclear antigen
MKTVDKDSVMVMKIDSDDEQYIKFELENNIKNNTTTYNQKVMDIDDDPTKLPTDTSFEMSVAMDTSDFRKICQEMNQFAEYVEITCTAREIKFRCQGDSSALERVFKSSDTTGVRIMCPEKPNGKKEKLVMVQAIYNLKHLVTFGKCVNLCTEMQLFLKNDYPLFINYPIGNIGKMLVGLSPVDEKTIKRDADYDDSNDKFYPNKKAIMKDV